MLDVFVDFETFYDHEYSLRKMTTQEYIMDSRFEVTGVSIAFGDDAVQKFNHTEVGAALRSVDWSRANMICHNTQFDGAILAWRYGSVPKLYSCTLAMGRAVFGSLIAKNGLAEMARLVGLYKDTTALTNMMGVRAADMVIGSPDHRRFMAYMGEDTEQCRRLYRLMMQRFPQAERIVVDIIMRMYIEGSFALDLDKLREGMLEDQQETERLLRCAGVTDVSDLRSRETFAGMLRDMGVEPPQKKSPATSEITYAFAKDDLEFTALLEHEDPRVAALVEAKLNASSSLSESRAARFIRIGETCGGELHVPLLYSGAHTHRFSGLDKLNLQNLPNGGALRAGITARKGKKLVAVDASQIEARIVAWLAGQLDLIEAFRLRRDVYSEFATKVYSKPVNKKDNPKERFVGKTGILGLGYGASYQKFHFMLQTSKDGWDGPIDFSEGVVQTYRTGYDRIPALWRRLENLLEEMCIGNTVSFGPFVFEKNRILLPSGLYLSYPKLERTQEYNEAWGGIKRGYRYWKPRYKGFASIYGAKLLENICQALARIQISQAMIKMRAMRPQWTCVLQVHDELIYMVDEDDAEECRDMLIRIMSAPERWADCFPYPLPLDAEGKIGDNYGALK